MRCSLFLLIFFVGSCGESGNTGGDATCASDDGKDASSDRGSTPQDGSKPRPTILEKPEPEAPSFPATVGEVTFYAETDFEIFGGAPLDHEISMCVSSSKCFPLSPFSPGFYPGSMDTFSYRDIGIAAGAVDRLQLKSVNGSNAWNPACFQMNVDGEAVYCRSRAPHIGNAPGEEQNFIDELGLHECQSCFQTPLTHGPMIGAVGETEARIWIRTDATRKVGLRVSSDPEMKDAVMAAWSYPRVEDDYTAVLHVEGLSPAARYFFQVEVDGRPHGKLGSFVTDIRAEKKQRIAVVSCTRWAKQNGFDTLVRSQPDLLLMAGDAVYANSVDLDVHRSHYRFSRAIAPRADAFAAIPTISVWDDHDFVGNNADGTAAGKEVSLRIFKEYWANPSYGDGDEGVYFTHRTGMTEFFMLDTRYFRYEGDMLGEKQEAWLIDALKASDAAFKFLVSGVQFTKTSTISTDEWQGHAPEARDRLFSKLAEENIEGVILVSGNIHRSEYRELNRDSGYALPEITSSGMANEPSGCRGQSVEEEAPGELQFCAGKTNTFVLVDIDETLSDPEVTVRYVDVLGDELYQTVIKRSELK